MANINHQLHLNNFPAEVRKGLKIAAVQSGVTFRDLVISVLRGYLNGLREPGSHQRVSPVQGVRGSVLLRPAGGNRGQERVAEAVGPRDRAPADDGAVDDSLREDQPEDQGDELEDLLGEPEW